MLGEIMGLYILDENKKPVVCEDISVWGKFIKNSENKRVAFTQVNKEVSVSTVFLGIDHNFGHEMNGVPILFETMVFGGFLDQEMMRYHTYEDALKCHEAMVDLLSKDA